MSRSSTDSLSIAEQTVHFGNAERMERIADDSTDLIVTSPPYWDTKDYDHPQQIGEGESYETYLERLDHVWDECARISSPGSVLAINVGKCRRDGRLRHLAMDIGSRLDGNGWTLLDDLIWYIPNALPQPKHYTDRLFDDKYENILLFVPSDTDMDEYTFDPLRVEQKYRDEEPRSGKLNDDGRSIGNVWKVRAYRPPTIKDGGYYSAAFPEELVYGLIHTFSEKGDRIVDPFCGSGTTLKVGRHMGRDGIGYEVNTELRDLIKRRISEHFRPPEWKTLDVLSGESPTRTRDTRGATLDEFTT